MSIRKPAGHMDQHPQNDWGAISYEPRFDEYTIPSGGAQQRLFYCPFCGDRLPESRRDQWFDELEARGVVDPWHDELPIAYSSDEWWRHRS